MRRFAPALLLLCAFAAAPALGQPLDPQNPYARPPAQALDPQNPYGRLTPVDPQNPYARPAPTPAPLVAQPCPEATNDRIWVAGQSMRRGQGLIGAAQAYWSHMHPFQPPPPQASTCPPPAQVPPLPPAGRR